MTTTIKNTETGEIVTIEVIDPKGGCDWSGDLIGNAGDLEYSGDDDCDFAGTTEQVSWWVDYCDRYDRYDNQLHVLLQGADIVDVKHVHNMLCDCDFNECPNGLKKAIEYMQSR